MASKINENTTNTAATEHEERRARDYQVTVLSASRELSPKERVMMKDTSSCILLNAEVEGGRSVDLDVEGWVELSVHNEHATDDKDYKNYIVLTKDGKRYVTGSPSFWTSFRDIMDDMNGVNEEWKLRVTSIASKKREGKEFLKCSVI